MTSHTSFEEKQLQDLLNPFAIPLKQKIPIIPKKKRIIVLAGPTAVGKTKLSLSMAKAIGGEIVSADSMQVYRGMDIGTAKIRPEERGPIRHHLVDSRDLDESFNVVDFYHEANQAFHEIFARDHVPIVVGGTGFYIHALLYGPPKGPPSKPDLRFQLEKEMSDQGPIALYERLKNLDPDYAKTITVRDRHKIVRALEIITLTQQKVSFFQPSREMTHDYDFRCWFVYMPKEVLYSRIEKRCDEMLTEGFVEEVRRLEKEGLRKNTSASQAIGYRQCLEFLSTPQTADDHAHFVDAFKQASRRYAKRQFTWFRKEPLFRWLNLDACGTDTALEMMIQDYELR